MQVSVSIRAASSSSPFCLAFTLMRPTTVEPQLPRSANPQAALRAHLPRLCTGRLKLTALSSSQRPTCMPEPPSGTPGAPPGTTLRLVFHFLAELRGKQGRERGVCVSMGQESGVGV